MQGFPEYDADSARIHKALRGLKTAQDDNKFPSFPRDYNRCFRWRNPHHNPQVSKPLAGPKSGYASTNSGSA